MGGGLAANRCVQFMQWWCCGFVFGDMDSCRDVPQYKVMKFLVFGIISSSLLSELQVMIPKVNHNGVSVLLSYVIVWRHC